MKRRKIFEDSMPISDLCLGTVHFGTKLSEKDSWSQLDVFFSQNGNFIDTANVYGKWADDGLSHSELTIGKWMKNNNRRHDMFISTKGGHPPLADMDKSRLGYSEVKKDLEESLRNLNTDYIDLYFLHRDDKNIPIDEMIGMLEQFRKEGKIVHYACSNWTLDRIKEADAHVMWTGRQGFSCNQLMWSMGDIRLSGVEDKSMVAMNKETYTYHDETSKMVMAYMSLCKGFFSKRLHGTPTDKESDNVYDVPSNRLLLERLPVMKKELGVPSTPILLSFIINQPFPAFPIASFRNLDQLKEGLMVSDFVLPSDMLSEIMKSRRFVYK